MALAAHSKQGMAGAPHAAAAQAGAEVLAEGGNAIEACVAMATTLAAVYPHMSGLGGDSFWLVHAPGAEVRAIMGGGRSAASATLERYQQWGLNQVPERGPKAALTVAGTVSAMHQALQISNQEWGGRLPLPRLLAEAFGYCRRGYAVSRSQALATAAKMPELVAQPGFAQTFLEQGRAPVEGQSLEQPRLADTLEQLGRAGLEDFYRGDLAQIIAKDFREVGSPLSLEDLQQHQAEVVAPLVWSQRQRRIYTTPPPTQGLATLLLLALCQERHDSSCHSESVNWIHTLVEATKRVYSGPRAQIADPDLMQVAVEDYLNADWVTENALQIDLEQAAAWPADLQAGGDTTWFGAMDAEGRAVSAIQSIYFEFGSGVVLPQSGLLWQNRGASFSLQQGALRQLRPKTLPFHTLCPSLAQFDDGREMVFGSMGGDGQPQTQAALFSRYADFDEPLSQAVWAPRWLLGRTWGGSSESLKLEARLPEAWQQQLQQRGHQIERVADFDEIMGHAGAIVRHADGRLDGAADPRGDGAAIAADFSDQALNDA